MKDKTKSENRLLTFHFPKIKKHPNLPLNYQFISHYSKTEVNEKGVEINVEQDVHKPISMQKLQTELSEFYGYYKPISRLFEDKNLIENE